MKNLAVKERPIPLITSEVRAILDGRKTMLRRVVKADINCLHIRGNPVQLLADWALSGLRKFENGIAEFDVQCDVDDCYTEKIKCPYGIPGDRLWVRETWAPDWEHSRIFYRADAEVDGKTVPFEMNGDSGFGGGIGTAVIGKWKPPIPMPRAASRILLEITNVRVERLQEITKEDAKAEGVERNSLAPLFWENYISAEWSFTSSVESFQSLWQSINGLESWEQNPWVWVIEFKKV